MSGLTAAAPVLAPALRHAIGHFATGVTVVSSLDRDAEPVGTTANAVTSLSLEPPLVLVCLDRSSSTLRAIRDSGGFAVNVLAAGQRELSANFARPGVVASWKGVPYELGSTASPRIGGALATLDCAVEELVPGGDHEIVIGRVHAADTSAEPVEPLLYWRGRYALLDGSA